MARAYKRRKILQGRARKARSNLHVRIQYWCHGGSEGGHSLKDVYLYCAPTNGRHWERVAGSALCVARCTFSCRAHERSAAARSMGKHARDRGTKKNECRPQRTTVNLPLPCCTFLQRSSCTDYSRLMDIKGIPWEVRILRFRYTS